MALNLAAILTITVVVAVVVWAADTYMAGAP